MNTLDGKLVQRHYALTSAVPTAFERELLGEINWDSAMVAVVGPRGVGKTTLLGQRLKNLALPPTEALYVDLGDLYFKANRLIDFAETFVEQGGKYLFIDEIHRYGFATWAEELKMIYDFYRSRLRVVFSGSSVLKLLNQSADLSRRVHHYYLQGLSFREYLILREGVEPPLLQLEDVLNRHGELTHLVIMEQKIEPLPHFTQYLRRGYYGFFIDDELGYYDLVNQIVQLVLSDDVPHATEMRAANVDKLSRLLQAVATSAPFKPNIAKLAERTGLSRNTLIEYLTLLERASLTINLRSDAKGIAALAKPDKVYLDNPNLIYALSPDRAHIGTVRETFFLNQLNYLQRRKLAFAPTIGLPPKGDFSYRFRDTNYLFEIGGPNKTAVQIGTQPGHFTVVDAKITTAPHRIPLWLFGLLY
ncbi:ATP-binding protein [Neolewinella sp.]|uniref:ATP-binding protein n=1 Tax=Neolewinella sp. TaxID=2993543 RepID=UPI003B51D543